MRNILTLTIAVALPFLMAAQPRSSFDIGWASTGSHCVEGDSPSLSPQKQAFNFSAWRGEKVFAQAYVSSDSGLKGVSVSVSDLRCGKSLIPSGCVRPQFVGFVTSDLLDSTRFGQCGERLDKTKWGEAQVADVLELNMSLDVPAGKVQPIWLTVDVPSDAKPGKYRGRITVSADNASARSLPIELVVASHVLPPASEWTFHLDLWQNPYSVARYENVPLWSEAHFKAMRPVMKMLADAGQKSVTATILNRPWNGQTEDAFGSMVTKIRRIDGTWLYDYTVFDRWVEFMHSVGIDRQINCYSLIPWAMEFDYFDQATGSVSVLKAAAGSPGYNDYWGSFIADFARHLRAKGWFDKTMIAMDERPLEAMKAVLSLIRRVEPEFKVSLAGSYHEPVIYDLADFSETFSGKEEFPEEVKRGRKDLGLTTTFYTCCSEAYPNTYLISNPDEAAWLGWFALADGYDGYLRWAYNSWTIDPLKDARFRTWAAGDCYIVYPGGRGSIRFSKLTEGIQDFEKVRILSREWQSSGSASDEAKLRRLSELLDAFTFESIRSEGPTPALTAAKSFLSRQ